MPIPSRDLTPGTPETRFAKKITANPSLLRVLTEGDSWFAFPLPSRPNAIDRCINRAANKAAWLRLEGNGDEASEILSGKQLRRLRDLLANDTYRFDALLFSAGGNDIVGENLEPMLMDHQPGFTWRDCIDYDRFWRRIERTSSPTSSSST
jgi:hypothetical protein